MSVCKCILWFDKCLWIVVEEVKDLIDEDCQIWQDLIDMMEVMSGVGMGVNQIGVMCQLIVVDVLSECGQVVKMVNLLILYSLIEDCEYEEVSLNLCGVFVKIKCLCVVIVCYMNEDGVIMCCDFVGFWVILVQYQIDYINGKMYFDYFSCIKCEMLIKKVWKLV